jgi:small-conductance mechanosensitive channel
LLALPTALLVGRVLGTDARLSLSTIAVVFASIAALDPLLGPLPMAGRGLHILQYLAVAAALWVDLRHGRLLIGDLLRPVVSRRLTQAVIVALVLAALASAAGSIGLARSLGHGALGAIGFWLVLVVLGHLLYGLGVAVLDARWAQHIRIVATRGADLRRWLRRGLVGAVGFSWLLGMLALLGLASDLAAWLQALLGADLAIGDATLSTGNIVAGVAVLVVTWLGVGLVRLLLEVEILPRLIRRRGVAFALSAVVRYGLVTAGVLLALAAMGVDLTKVTVLAGALGVGIGFGLQSVVNNFFSGLILLVERPVTAGDVVQVDGVQGVVASIGVRSTTVRTPDGAEVIVPNADLISKVVSNWTLSDNRCRVEIEVNVPSAVDPDQAIRLLEAAATELDEVAQRPAPRAWLAGLRGGERSYRLHAWIADYDAQTAVQGALRLRIARRFAQDGVALP